MPSQNLGRLINQINGINGVSAGSAAVVNLPVNQRYHRNVYQCVAVNYTGAATANALFSGTITAAAVVNITGTGSGATVNLTVVNGAITAIAANAGGTGYAVGDKFTIADATGTGFVGTVATLSTSALATATVTSGGTPSPISPVVFFSAVQELVNGINMRDIAPADIINTAAANNILWRLGQLSLYYTEPFFNVNRENEMLSWDMYGQSTFTHKLNIAPSLVSPGLTGISEFDFLRNVKPTANDGQVPFLQPVSKHNYGFNVISGINRINTLPFDYPIRRLWIQGSSPGNITGLIVYQDANKVFEVYAASQMQVMYEDYGFQFGRSNYVVATYGNAANNTLKGVINPVSYYDMAYISDPDQRIFKALSCDNSLVLQVTSAVAQSITVTMEVLPGAYAA
jgi:hypothetical protein